MKLRQVLARRLRELMDKTPALDTQVKVSKAADVAQTTISRILKCQVGATLDNVEAIASVFGVTPAELLAQSHVNSAVITDDDRRTIQRLSVLLRTENSVEKAAIHQSVGRTSDLKKVRKKIERNPLPHQAQARRAKRG